MTCEFFLLSLGGGRGGGEEWLLVLTSGDRPRIGPG